MPARSANRALWATSAPALSAARTAAPLSTCIVAAPAKQAQFIEVRPRPNSCGARKRRPYAIRIA